LLTVTYFCGVGGPPVPNVIFAETVPTVPEQSVGAPDCAHAGTAKQQNSSAANRISTRDDLTERFVLGFKAFLQARDFVLLLLDRCLASRDSLLRRR